MKEEIEEGLEAVAAKSGRVHRGSRDWNVGYRSKSVPKESKIVRLQPPDCLYNQFVFSGSSPGHLRMRTFLQRGLEQVIFFFEKVEKDFFKKKNSFIMSLANIARLDCPGGPCPFLPYLQVMAICSTMYRAPCNACYNGPPTRGI